MKKYFISLLTMLCSVLMLQTANAQTLKSKQLIGVKAGYGFNITITQGNSGVATIDVDSKLQPYLNAEIKNNILIITLDDVPRKLLNQHLKKSATITVTSLEEISLSSAAQLLGKGSFTTDDLSIKVSSAASIKDLDITAKNIEISLSSAAKAILSGSTNNLNISTSSAAQAKMDNLQAKDVTARSSSGSSIKCSHSNSLAARASSGSSISYKGTNNIDKAASSGGSINQL